MLQPMMAPINFDPEADREFLLTDIVDTGGKRKEYGKCNVSGTASVGSCSVP
jgi:hypothetical protein